MTLYGQLLCVAAAKIWLPSIMFKNKGGVPNEAYLSAHQAPPFQGSWLPPENGYCQRPQGSRPPPRQGPQGSVRLSIALRDRTPAFRVKRETVRGESCRPAPFLFGADFRKYFPAGATVLLPQYCALKTLEYTKYACGFQSLPCCKIPRRPTKKSFL